MDCSFVLFRKVMMLEKLDGGNKPCAKVLPRKETLDLMIPPPPTPEDEKGGDQTKEGADESSCYLGSRQPGHTRRTGRLRFATPVERRLRGAARGTFREELNQANEELVLRLDRLREEFTRIHTKLQNEHLAISSQLHKCQVELEQHLAESQERRDRLNRALEEKELKESQVGVITMAIEQLFSRTAMMDATDIKFAPVRGDKGESRLEESRANSRSTEREMFKQIIERVEDLQEMHATAQLSREKQKEEETLFDEGGFMDRIKFVYQRGDDDGVSRRDTDGLGAGNSTLKGRPTDPNLSAGSSKKISGDSPGNTAMRKENERTQLLWKTLIQAIPLAEAAELFQSKGHEPPTEQELMDLRTNTLAHVRQKTSGRRQFMKSALKNKAAKGQTKRFLNNEMVTVGKKDKYLHSGGESAEDKAKTSVELYIIGIGRGGRHAVKVAMHEKKKGPMSNKHHK
eukprot:g10427.t1